ncbi:GNAT family N-acetyltransferase [Pseudobdellovibrio exovorus]|uniref:Acetyltransferase n=1 Tax=Pseudobdellovibrio exovorus JSS TaxID=1184267 RepID=M4VEE0_9BACT|nr:GNAT family N-acetyltransferase [Pseudobdellovibrio exovorus]AGH96401.1 acetyltransferase [Pseudobdellovibrio exovorus JSS]
MGTTESYKTLLISTEQTYDLRDRVLRGPRPPESIYYPGDEVETTFHVGVVQGDRVLSNGTFMKQSHPHFPDSKSTYRLRGMATDPEFQGQGFGQLVINAALEELKLRKADLIWFNGRTSAEAFYRKLGFLVEDEIFDIPGAGPHKVMYKSLV